jgi:hypothetical protein
MPSPDIAYRGYILVLGEQPPMLHVHIYATEPKLPQPMPGSDAVSRPTRDAAIAEAKRIVDELLEQEADEREQDADERE